MNYKLRNFDMNTKEGEEEIWKRFSKDAGMVFRNWHTGKIIHDIHIKCNNCFLLFKLFELLEDYHEAIVRLPKLIRFKRGLPKKIDELIRDINKYRDSGTLCKCEETQQVEYINQDNGLIALSHVAGEYSMFYHYNNLVLDPYYVNQLTLANYGAKVIAYGCEPVTIIEDNFLDIIFNEQDTNRQYQPQQETPYNTRLHYRLKNRNFLKLKMHTMCLDTEYEYNYTDVTLYRDYDMILKELEFWREYFTQPHTLILNTIIALGKKGLNNDCIYHISKYL